MSILPMSDPPWRFSSSLGQDRISKLAKAPSFDDIAKAVNSEMEVLCGHAEKLGTPPQVYDLHCWSPPTNEFEFWRVVFTVLVSGSVFDWFFNSTRGYRASYFHSPENGLQSNRRLIETVLDKLLDTPSIASDCDWIRRFARESMTSGSAKAWLTEKGNELCNDCRGEVGLAQDCMAELENGRWELANCPLARSGRKAPCGTKIKFMGAFLDGQRDGQHNELIPARKRFRSREIFQYGWS